MHVKRHLNRLFGSLRRKDHKTVKDKVDKVVQQFQFQHKAQTASRWELLDYDREDSAQLDTLSEPQAGETTIATCPPTSFLKFEVQVELTPNEDNNTKNSLNNSSKQKLERKWSSKRRKKEKKYEHIEVTEDTQKIDEDLCSVVEEINKTIGLMGEFVPNEVVSLGPSAPADGNEVTRNPWTPVPLPIEVTLIDTTNIQTCNLVPPNRNPFLEDPEKILSLQYTNEEGSRLTIEKVINLENLDRNEETRPSWAVFTPETEQDEHRIPSHDGEAHFTHFLALGDTLKSSEYGHEHHGHHEHHYFGNDDCADVGGGDRPGAPEMKRLGLVRRSGRSLYNKIHKRFKKKSKEEQPNRIENVESVQTLEQESEICYDIDTHPEESSTTRFTRSRERSSGKDVKRIDDDRWWVSPTRLSRSFRKVIPFQKRLAFEQLDNNPNGIEDNQNTYVQRDISRQNVVQEVDFKAKATGLTTHLSTKTLGKPVRGMRRILKKGVSAFGRSMMHASAVMPIPMEYPQSSGYKYNPDGYDWDDEDYFYEFRRYCQSAEEDYQHQFRRESVQKFYQSGYCAN